MQSQCQLRILINFGTNLKWQSDGNKINGLLYKFPVQLGDCDLGVGEDERDDMRELGRMLRLADDEAKIHQFLQAFALFPKYK